MKKIFGLALISLLGITSLTIVHAAGPSAGISPSANNESMNYEIKPGTKVEDSFTLKNMGSEKGTFEVRVIDLEETKGVALWTTLSEQNVTLEPDQMKPINFTITVPENTPKEKVYKGAIVAKIKPVAVETKTKSVGLNETGGNIAITSEVSTRLTVKVTDNPVSLGGSAADTANANSSDSGIKYIAFVLVTLLILSIGYFFFRKK